MNDLTNINTIKALFERHGFSFSKTLGQNFLINPSVCPKIAEMGDADEEHGILEIGTGVGVLTNELAKRAKKVVAVEIDKRLLPILDETLAEHDNVEVINADIMELDLARLFEEKFSGMKVSVCANLPYYITSPIIMSLLEQRLPIDKITVMVQREAGVRFCAPLPSREAGAVTVAINYFSTPKILFNVSRGSFLPAPNVDSCVVQFDVNSEAPCGIDEKFFFEMVRGAFSQRRKTFVNSVSSSMKLDKALVSSALIECGVSETARPEHLSMNEFITISEALKNMINA